MPAHCIVILKDSMSLFLLDLKTINTSTFLYMAWN